MVDFYIKPKIEPIKSDGKSSSYYDINLSEKTKKFITENGYVKTEHLIYDMFGNDFDFGNAFKSLVRAYGITHELKINIKEFNSTLDIEKISNED